MNEIAVGFTSHEWNQADDVSIDASTAGYMLDVLWREYYDKLDSASTFSKEVCAVKMVIDQLLLYLEWNRNFWKNAKGISKRDVPDSPRVLPVFHQAPH